MDHTNFLREEIKKLKSDVNSVNENGYRQLSVSREILKEIYNYRTHGMEEKSEVEKGNYKYIPFNYETFVEMILVLQKKFHKKSFIDIGCGIGDKVILAEIFGDFEKVTGIELNETTYHVAKYFCLIGQLPFQNFDDYFKKFHLEKGKLTAKTEREILHENAFDHNFSEYDFIYMYSPIQDGKLLRKLYEKVLLEMPIGGIILEVLTSWLLIEVLEDLGVKIIYKKGGKDARVWYEKRVTVRKSKNSYIVERVKNV
jgi:hypothetical protein